jgi:hypothetical protein
MLFEIAKCDFPIRPEPLIIADRWHESRASGFRSTEGHVVSDPAYRSSAFRGFDTKGALYRVFAIREIPRLTWQCGTQRLTGGQVACSRSFGVRSFVLHETHNSTTSDFPIGKSPIRERVDPLTIGVRGLAVHVNCVRVKRELPKSEFPISERKNRRRRLLWVADSRERRVRVF